MSDVDAREEVGDQVQQKESEQQQKEQKQQQQQQQKETTTTTTGTSATTTIPEISPPVPIFAPMKYDSNKKVALFCLFQHGINGRVGSLHYLKERVMKYFIKACPNIGEVKFFDTTVNQYLSSNDGVVLCADRLLKELVPAMKEFADENTKKGYCLNFSMVGLSFGGILIREIAYRLQQPRFLPLTQQFSLDVFLTIATPHTGACDNLAGWKKAAGRLLGNIFSASYEELLLVNDVFSNYLINDEHIEALKHFRERILLSNLEKDSLVGFGTSSLMVEVDEKSKVEKTNMVTSTISNIISLIPDAGTGVKDPPDVYPNNLLSDAILSPETAEASSPSSSSSSSSASASASSSATTTTPYVQPNSDEEEHKISLKIARTLRAKLTWKVVAVKPQSFFNTAHHAIVGASFISEQILDSMDAVGHAITQKFGGIVPLTEENLTAAAAC